MEKIINFAVIGASNMAKAHMRSIMSNPNANLYAVCDINPEALEPVKQEMNPEVLVTDYKTLVADPKVEAVVIVTPDQIHLEMTEAFLRAGKDVLCEKPMALSIEECEKMMQVEKETGRKLMIGQIVRCTPAFMKAREIINEGRIGELFYVESEYAHNYDHAKGANNWRMTPARDGFIGGGCHAVDLLRWIAGNPTEVTAYANHKCLTDWPSNDCTIAIFKFPNDVVGKVFVSTGCRRNYTMRTVLYGTRGTIICDNTHPEIYLYTMDEPLADGTSSFTTPQILTVDIRNHNSEREINDFVRALVEDTPVPVPSIEGASTVTVCCTAVRSAKENRSLTIEYPKY